MLRTLLRNTSECSFYLVQICIALRFYIAPWLLVYWEFDGTHSILQKSKVLEVKKGYVKIIEKKEEISGIIIAEGESLLWHDMVVSMISGSPHAYLLYDTKLHVQVHVNVYI